MPLINLKTDLKSLKFGKDRPGGGSSNQPYVVKDIPSQDEDSSNIFNTGGPDFLLRGGLMAPLKVADDTSRLTQMFIDLKSPRGLLFTAKEEVLSRSAVKTESSTGVGYGGGLINSGIYTPLNTILQTVGGFAGTHLNLLGIDPSSPMTGVIEGGLIPGAGLNRYGEVVGKQNLYNYSDDNRLLNILNKKQTKKLYSSDVMEYGGGPGSILGVGKTSIKFADQRTGVNNYQSISNPKYFYTGSRPNDKTTDDWVNPIQNGVTFKYSQYTDTPFNSLYDLTVGTGYTSEPKFNFLTTNPNSLTARENLKSYQAIRPVSRTSGSIIWDMRGVSKLYSSWTNYDFNFRENYTQDGGYTLEPNFNYSTTNSGSLEARGDVKEYLSTYSSSIGVTYKDGATKLYQETTSQDIDTNLSNKEYFDVYNPDNILKNSPLQSANNSSTYTQEQIVNSQPISKGGLLQDFRIPLLKGKTSSTIMSLSPSYGGGNAKNIESRVNLGDPGKSKNVLKYSTSTEILDKITASEIYSAENPNHSGQYNDLVKFSIGIQKTDSTEARFMNFRAFIDSFSDQYSADWGDVRYIGRGDKFYNYKGFDRKVSLSFTIVAQSKAELIPMYKKLNYLASSLAPNYSTGGFMQGNLARLTLGGYFYDQLGIITGFTYDIPNESTWEIGIDEEGNSDSTVKELPHMIKITGFNFIPIHDFVPKKVGFTPDGKQDNHFIALSNGSNNNY